MWIFLPPQGKLMWGFSFLTVHSAKPVFSCLLLENVGAEHDAFTAGQWMNSWWKHVTFESSFSKHCSFRGKSKLIRFYLVSPCVPATGIGIFSSLQWLSSAQMNLPPFFCRQMHRTNILLRTEVTSQLCLYYLIPECLYSFKMQ